MIRSRQRDNIIAQIEAITGDLLTVKKKIVVLGDMQGLSRAQKTVIESLLQGLDGVRGCELGQARQSLGIDEELRRKLKGLRK